MSDNELHHERDDELLSAYVDGELAEEERAAVEARLASDPEAERTLQQLRSVSQAVQALPLESIGRDLREQILRRVEKMKPAARVATALNSAAAEDTTPRLSDTMPKFTIFQTRRSWVWASLVVAAGLLIMALQSGDERGKNLPAVASRNKDKLADATRGSPLRRSFNEPAPAAVDPAQVAIADSSTPAPMAAAPVTSMPAERKVELRDEPSDEAIRPGKVETAGRPSPPPGNLADGQSVSGASPPSPAPMNRSVKLSVNAGSKVATGTAAEAAPESVAAPQPTGPGVAGGGALGALGRRLELNDERNPLVVVHVVAKQDAFNSKAFDRLLVSNRIELEPELQTEERAGGASDRFARQAEVDRAAGRAETKPAGGEQDVELVLVEAPQQAIESCLAGLNKDSENYPGVEVVEPAAAQDREDVKATLDKKVATGLRRYSRGVVSQQQKDSFSNRYYSYKDAEKDRAKVSYDFQGGFRAKDKRKPQQEVEQLLEQRKGLENLGRARRVASSDMENRPAEKPASSGGAVRPQDTGEVKLRGAQPELKTPAGADASTVHVLFVLSPEREAASSAPAEKSAK